jgi:hypothetical protein
MTVRKKKKKSHHHQMRRRRRMTTRTLRTDHTEQLQLMI